MKYAKILEIVDGYNSVVFNGTVEECESKKKELDKSRSSFVKMYMQKCHGKYVSLIEYRIF